MLEGRGDAILDRMTREHFTEVLLSKDSNAKFHEVMEQATLIFTGEFSKRVFQAKGTASTITPGWVPAWLRN